MNCSTLSISETGDWEDLVIFGEHVSMILFDEENDSTSKDLAEHWEYWRPKDSESPQDISDKTVEPYSETSTATKEEAKEELQKVKKPARDNILKAAIEKLSHFTTAIKLGTITAATKFETSLYTHLMFKFSPWYFNSEELVGSLDKKYNPRNENTQYILTLNINETELRETMKQALKKNVKSSDAAEKLEQSDEVQSESDTNHSHPQTAIIK
jgi:hypothetical protein